MHKMRLILQRPVITEKSSKLQEDSNQYTFLVQKGSNKITIRKAIEEKYGVKVASVNTMNYRGHTKRVGRFVGRKSDFKKAVVTLRGKDEKIEYFSNNE